MWPCAVDNMKATQRSSASAYIQENSQAEPLVKFPLLAGSRVGIILSLIEALLFSNPTFRFRQRGSRRHSTEDI